MNNEFLELRREAKEYLNQMTIVDSDAFISNILFDITETDDSNIEIKKKTLQEIQNWIDIKHKIKTKNDDLYYLKNLCEQLNFEHEDLNLYSLIKVINSSKEENYFITLKAADDYVNSLEYKDNIQIMKIQVNQLSELLKIIKRNF